MLNIPKMLDRIASDGETLISDQIDLLELAQTLKEKGVFKIEDLKALK